MTTPEVPPSSPPPRPPVLGVDPPTTPVAPAPVAPVAPVVAPQPAPSMVQVDAQELEQLQQASRNYSTLLADDQLQGVIYGHLRDRAAGIVSAPDHVPAQPNGQPVDPNAQPSPMEGRLAALEQGMRRGSEFITRQQTVIEQQQGEIATLRGDMLGQSNPSFNNHRAAVEKLVQDNPGLSRERALTLIEAEAARAGNGTVEGGNPPTPTTEGGGGGPPSGVIGPSGGTGELSDDTMADLASRVNDPNAAPSMDDAFNLIAKAHGLDV